MNPSPGPRIYYFGPWDQPGHYMRARGIPADLEERRALGRFTYTNPWGTKIDGGLCPGARDEGHALLHRRDGWTALSFWDYSVDTRPGSNSTYLGEGEFSFEEMVAMAKEHFA